jgi:uncharacterized protein (DUF488 family)
VAGATGERVTSIWTVGHSTRSLEELVDLLREQAITVLADVRTLPGSKRHPQFDLESLEEELPRHGLRYVHFRALGGLRRPLADSPNLAWRNSAFRGYADYMQTLEWERAVGELLDLAATDRVAVMCAEAVPWRCHRSLLADGLVVRGVEVRHITGKGAPAVHSLTSFAHVEGLRVTYPGSGQLPLG